jgi:hypothetical protein
MLRDRLGQTHHIVACCAGEVTLSFPRGRPSASTPGYEPRRSMSSFCSPGSLPLARPRRSVSDERPGDPGPQGRPSPVPADAFLCPAKEAAGERSPRCHGQHAALAPGIVLLNGRRQASLGPGRVLRRRRGVVFSPAVRGVPGDRRSERRLGDAGDACKPQCEQRAGPVFGAGRADRGSREQVQVTCQGNVAVVKVARSEPDRDARAIRSRDVTGLGRCPRRGFRE